MFFYLFCFAGSNIFDDYVRHDTLLNVKITLPWVVIYITNITIIYLI